ncbi:uncharacterized protein DNG_04931 [Cephalotrichum gorgonifer]|uniref:U6 snRNA phosphodiesterase n=1 Tax=Cephalotrichum gorgonifer TaxID=2041049 RepID=A0AAE8MZH8_9PEZI|nr:uncharacterized protein DNG_04931 [Cephalotrichum gorgonifer]
MGLVDYRSDSEADSDSGPEPEPKRRKSSPAGREPAAALPPLPEAFHDLYASTVRQSVVDDPALHQGRRRVNPHIVGNWPSHIYIEWHPTGREHDALTSLVDFVRKKLGERSRSGSGSKGGRSLTSLLTSDLGAPLPLHISLSRPLALTTAQKDEFLAGVSAAIRGSRTSPFSVNPTSLHFFKSPDSNRTFLVLKIHPVPDYSPPAQSQPSKAGPEARRNPLTTLLQKCNAVAAEYSLPLLYARRETEAGSGVDERAFHLSLAWTLDEVTDDEMAWTERLLDGGPGEGVKGWDIRVGGVKLKIGNVVTHVPLGASSEKREGFGW